MNTTTNTIDTINTTLNGALLWNDHETTAVRVVYVGIDDDLVWLYILDGPRLSDVKEVAAIVHADRVELHDRGQDSDWVTHYIARTREELPVGYTAH